MLKSFRLGYFTKFIAVILSLFLIHVSFAAEKPSKELSALEEKIGQAKILYYDFQFKKSEQLLKEVIDSLKLMTSSPVVNHDLSEAYLRLALTQDAQSLSKPMQESLYQSVTYETSRELDPSQFAPTIVAQFNKAKQKYLMTQNQIIPSSNKLALQSSDVKQKNESQPLGQKTKKPFYKTWPFFLIIGLVVAGGGAGAAIALSGGGGGSGPVTVGGTPQ